MTTVPSPSRMTPGLTLLFAIAGGAAVGNLYWAQPLLEFIAHDLHASPAHAGWLITATQIGYAVGVFLIVPLGDVLDRRRLLPTAMACSALALLGCALAPTFPVLLIAMIAVGLTTVSGQLLTPLAGDLAEPRRRGHVVGLIASGLLTGILLSRTISGLVAGLLGWRAIFAIAAAGAVLLAALLARSIPHLEPRTRLPYRSLLASVFTSVRAHPAVPYTLLMGATGFAVFTMFWTALTFLLSAPPYSFSVTAIGLVGLVGLAGALAAQRAGRLHDRGWSVPANGIALAGVLIALVLAGVGGRSIVLLLIAILLLDVAMQANGVLSQTRLFAVAPESRSRLNTAYVTSNFVGGSIGSAVAAVLWQAGGWTAVTVGGAVLTGFALTVWTVGSRGPLAVPVHRTA
jgi:predicted MFS family arabinose efflux permease